MPHTGLITFHFAHHYGAQLQAYATMRAIQGLGFSCEIIDYRLPHTTQTNHLWKAPHSARDILSNTHTMLHYPAFQTRFRRFEDFVSQHMALSPKRYLSFDALEADPPAYEVYAAGSDQIWNPFIFQDRRFDCAFFLAFARQGRKIAYAPSLGVSALSEDKAAELKNLLSSFSALSVREKQGQALLKDLTGRDAPVVLDPTLLLTGAEWSQLAVPPSTQQPYILCYFVSDPGEAAPYALALSEHTGLPIVQLAGVRRRIPGAKKLVFDAGPREFLGLFQHAAAVCTNSFHGAVFSLQFGRPFFTSMSPKERADPTLSRIYSLLSQLDCTDRIIGLDDTAPLDTPMPYDTGIYPRLESARTSSLAYLKAALEGTSLPTAPVRTEQPPSRPVLCSAALCTGCTACASICPVAAISMEPDHEGFLRPKIGDTCILCRKCERVCPGLNPPKDGASPAAVHAVWNQDEAVQKASSSGGFFSLLAGSVLEQGGAVFGAVLEGHTVRHTCARSLEELAPMRGSKYVQSDAAGCFQAGKELLDQNIPVLFSGTPCQIDGFRRFLGQEYSSLLTCDLVCHGVPSPAVFSAYLDRLEADRGSAVTGVRFKDKSHGWQHPWFTVSFADGSSYTEDFNRTTYGRGFGMQLFLRPCCEQCFYTNPGRRPADFTLADFWGLDPNLALPVPREQGISMVMVNTPKGEAVFSALKPLLGQVERPIEEAIQGNPRLISPLHANPRRGAFFAAFAALPFRQAEQAFLALPPLPYRLAAKVLTPQMKARLRRFLG